MRAARYSHTCTRVHGRIKVVLIECHRLKRTVLKVYGHVTGGWENETRAMRRRVGEGKGYRATTDGVAGARRQGARRGRGKTAKRSSFNILRICIKSSPPVSCLFVWSTTTTTTAKTTPPPPPVFVGAVGSRKKKN